MSSSESYEGVRSAQKALNYAFNELSIQIAQELPDVWNVAVDIWGEKGAVDKLFEYNLVFGKSMLDQAMSSDEGRTKVVKYLEKLEANTGM